MKDVDRRRTMREYLLGELPDTARQEMDEHWFTDPGAFEELLAAEDDMVDDYVRGRLSGGDRKRFEQAYFSTPERAEKVRLARSLLQRVDESGVTPRRAGWAGMQSLRLAAAMLVLIAGVWIAQRNAGPARENSREVAVVAPRSVVVFVLSPGLTRGGGVGDVLRLFPEAGEVELQWDVEVSGYEHFEAELKTAEGGTVCRGENLRLGTDGRLAMRVPAARLRVGDYLLMVKGGMGRVNVGVYSFRVSR